MNTPYPTSHPHRHHHHALVPARHVIPAPKPLSKTRPVSSPCIRATDVTLVFQGQTLYQHLDLTIPQGGITVLAPQDNLCKAGLFELLAGRCSPAAGQCLVYGHASDDMPVDMRQQIALLENGDRLYEVMTIGQTAIFFSGCFPGWSNELFRTLIEELGLTRRMKISNLSHQQRVLIALALLLARHPQLLVIDDWISGLDPATNAFIYQALYRYRDEGTTTLLLGNHAGIRPDRIDHLVLLGSRTALTLPSTDLLRTDTLNRSCKLPSPVATTRVSPRNDRSRTR